MTWDLALSIIALIVALVAIFASLSNYRRLEALKRERRRTRMSGSTRPENLSEEADPGPAVVIYNPTKSADWDYLRETLSNAASDASLPEPVWVETTAEDPGPGQARQAIEDGASVVIAAGGDGTVRAIAQELTGTNIPLGLLPVGTGNLLARNLDLPLGEARAMAIIALTGKNRPIDVGWMEVPVVEEQPLVEDGQKVAEPGKHAFVVMAGIGFDADIMAQADEQAELKAKLGWLAYLKAAVPHLLAPKLEATITTGPKERSVTTDARSVMFLNCGELVGGIVMDQGAKFDDGWLELAVLDTRGGLIGWIDLVRRVGLKGLGLKALDFAGVSPAGDLDMHRIRQCTVTTHDVHQIQVDGDVLGYANHVTASIDHNSLFVRVRN